MAFVGGDASVSPGSADVVPTPGVAEPKVGTTERSRPSGGHVSRVPAPPHARPGVPVRVVVLDRPPAPVDTTAAGGLVQVALPALGGVGMVLFMIAGGHPLLLVAGLVMLVVTVGGAVGMYVSTRSGARRRFTLAREKYLRHLDDVRAMLREDSRRQRDHDDDVHPDPVALLARVLGGQVRRRGLADDDAWGFRIGRGTAPHPVRVDLPEGDTDPVVSRAMASLTHAHRVLPGAPLLLDPSDGDVVLRGPAEDVRGVARALLLQSACAVGPERLAITVLTPAPEAYAWARWLPHLAGDDARLRLHTVAAHSAPPRLADLGARPTNGGRHLVVVEQHGAGSSHHTAPSTTRPSVPGAPTPAHSPDTGPWVVHALLDDDEAARLEVDPATTEVILGHGGGGFLLHRGATVVHGVPDLVHAGLAETTARAIASRNDTGHHDGEPTGPFPGVRVLGVDDLAQFDPEAAWRRPRAEHDLLTVVLGRDDEGREARLDLKESGHGGSGPHGVLVGATGSGKSELLRSLVLGLTGTHHPDDLALILVDYKGGATFSGLEELPHVAGLVTNLGDDLGLVDRMHSALLGEIRRRQQVLHDAGHLLDVYAYRAARAAGRSGCETPLPHLLVVIDEFAELLAAVPDIHDLFTTIGRIGRSIGVHQLLASQRLDDGRLRGLEAFLSYRIALRTFTAEESRAVIGSSAAAELPSAPGQGYLRTGSMRHFEAAYVSAPQPGVRRAPSPVEVVDWLPEAVTSTAARGGTAEPGHDPAAGEREREPVVTVLHAAVARMTGAAPRTRPVWLPPLPALLDVDELHRRYPEPGRLVARVGLVDLPSEQRTAPLDLDLARGACHVAILGGPDSGRSSALRTLAYALAVGHPVSDLVVHGVDLDGDALRALEELPHTGSIAGRRDEELLRRVLRETLREIDRRAAHRAVGSPEVLLLVDGYSTLRTREDLHEQVLAILTRGADVGVHVALTASRWHDLRPPVQTVLHSRIELRLADPLDSVVDRRLAEHLPRDVPGRALVATDRIAQVAAVSAGGVEGERRAYRDLAERSVERARPVPMLPTDLRLTELLAVAEASSRRPTVGTGDAAEPDETSGTTPAPGGEHEAGTRWWIGVEEDDLAPVGLGADGPHLLVLGDRRSGRTSVLRAILSQCLAEPDTVVALLDPRRTLIDAVPSGRLAAYASGGHEAGGVVLSLAEELRARAGEPSPSSPGAGADRPPRTRTRIVLVVDDADLLGGGLDPLAPLGPYLAAGDDLGFALLVARHSGGAARALYDPVLGRLKELGCPGLLLSGDPEEGPLWPGAPMRPLPPGRAVLARRGRAPTLCHLARP